MIRVFFLVLFLLPSTAWAQGEKRIALLIGNKDYKTAVGALMNPLNDIRLVGNALTAVGFEVLSPAQNATRAAMLRAIHEFATKLGAAGPNAVGFLYYSGHGVASAGENYLIPVDVEEPSTVELEVQGVKNSEVLAILLNNAPNAAHYLILDACRNNLKGARGGRGFLPVGQKSGLLVAFSTEPGKTASDTGQASGPYAAALAIELVRPGQSDLIMFHNVRVAVIRSTNGDQVPWTEDGIQRPERVWFAGQNVPTERSTSSEGPTWTAWLDQIGYQREFDSNLKKKQYPRIIEARSQQGAVQYRAVYEPYPKDDFAFYARHSISDEEFAEFDAEMAKKGYARVYQQRIMAGSRAYNQGVWIKP